jgi:hypothetical protein
MKDRKVKQVLSGYGNQWERGGHKKKVKDGDYGEYTFHSCAQIEQ